MGSQYKQIDGVRYERDLLEKAEAAAKDGQISVKEANELWQAAQDGSGVTETERNTLKYILEKFKFTEKAAEFLRPLVEPTEEKPTAKPGEVNDDIEMKD